jgi:diguanylate cyclase (GGDEF)-like protein/PAS domain S-box-containing protein
VLLAVSHVVHAQGVNSSAAPLDNVVLQLKWKHQFQFAGYYAALEQGYYRDAGLNVAIHEAPDTRDPSRLVISGVADFGIGASDLVVLRSQGQPVVALAAIYQHSPQIFLAATRSGIDSLSDLAGKRIMLEPGSAALLAYLNHEDVPLTKMTFLPHTFDPQSLLNGHADAMSAYSTDEPFLLKQAHIGYLTFNPRAGGIDFYGDTLFTTQREIDEHPARVKAFLAASLRGWQYAMDHPAEMIDLILRKYSKRHSRAHLEFESAQTRKLIAPDVVEIGYMNPGRWRQIADTYAELGMIPRGFALNGFLYDRNPRPNLNRYYRILIGVIAALILVTLIACRFYILNSRIRQEVSERIKSESHLQALEKRYRILAEYAPYPILITSQPDGVVIYCNPAAAAKLEILPDFLIGRRTLDYYQDQTDREKLVALLDRQGFIQNREVPFVTSTGAVFWASVSASTITFDDQEAIFIALSDITERKALEDRLHQMAMTDDLTGLLNRRSLLARGAEAITGATRNSTDVALLMIDADHFKSINDRLGHEAGDIVLIDLAAFIQDQIEPPGVVGRIGGEEFAILLPNSGIEHAKRIAESLRSAIERHTIVAGGHALTVTISVGIAVLDGLQPDFSELMRRADAALYVAKRQGRNRVALASEPRET